MTRKSPILLQRRNFYLHIALVLIALLLLGFSLFALIVQVMPAAASPVRGEGYPNVHCGMKCQTETAIASMTVTQPITITVPVTKTVPITITVPVTKTAAATATPTTDITPSTTPTPDATPTNTLTPAGPGTPTSSSGTSQPQTTSTAQSTPSTGTGVLPGGGGDNGNTPGGALGGFFTAAAFILGILAFLLYLVPQRAGSLSVLNKILSLIMPVSLLRRLDDE